jgi:hypothetical protein
MNYSNVSNKIVSGITLAAKSKILSGLGGSGALLGLSESPRMMFTRQYSIKARNTNLKQNIRETKGRNKIINPYVTLA